MNKVISPIAIGDSSPAVTDLQNALIKLGFDQISQDELRKPVFADTTCNALNKFKDKFSIKSFPCLVDSKTADAINIRLARLVNNPGEVPIKVIPPLFFGMNSAAVLDLQNALMKFGFGAGIDPAEKKTYQKTTCSAVINFQRELQIQVNACYVDDVTADKINSLIDDTPGNDNNEKYKVSGHVYDRDNKVVGQQPVNAYDVDLLGSGIYKKAVTISELTSKGGIQLLGTGITDDNGFYSIEFTSSAFKTDESEADPTADVLVIAADGDGILGKSRLSKNRDYKNNELLEWNVAFLAGIGKRGTSEYEQVSTVLLKFLEAQINKIEPWQMKSNPDMVEFLSDEIQISLEKANAFINADFMLHDITDIRNEVPSLANDPQKTRELLYGLARPLVLLEWPTIAKTSTAEIKNDIKQSAASNIISNYSEDVIAAFADDLHSLSIRKSLSGNPVLKSILNTALKNDTLTEKFHSIYVNHTGTPEEFWSSLKQDNDFKDKIESLKVTNQLSALTGNNSAVMERLTLLSANNDAVALLDLSTEKWNEAIGDNIPSFINGASDDEKKDNYREFMRRQLHAAFYNEKVSRMVKNENEIKIADEIIRQMLNRFLETTKFDLRLNRLYDKLPGSEETFQSRLDTIGGAQKEKLKNELNKIQRVFQFSPSPEIMTKLLDSGINSATMVASMPFSSFKVKYKDLASEQILLTIHSRASHIVSMLEYSILSLHSFSQNDKVPAISGH